MEWETGDVTFIIYAIININDETILNKIIFQMDIGHWYRIETDDITFLIYAIIKINWIVFTTEDYNLKKNKEEERWYDFLLTKTWLGHWS